MTMSKETKSKCVCVFFFIVWAHSRECLIDIVSLSSTLIRFQSILPREVRQLSAIKCCVACRISV
jgi:hypothetical protein